MSFLLLTGTLPVGAIEKHKILSTDKTPVEVRQNRNKWLDLFIADRYFTCQCYREITIFRKKWKNHHLTGKIPVSIEDFLDFFMPLEWEPLPVWYGILFPLFLFLHNCHLQSFRQLFLFRGQTTNHFLFFLIHDLMKNIFMIHYNHCNSYYDLHPRF